MSNHRDPVPDWLNANYLQEVLKESLNDKSITVNSIDIKPCSTEGDNYCCQVFRISINFSSSSKTNENLSLIGKLKPNTALVSELDKIFDLFGVEASFFSTLQQKLDEILKDKPYTPKSYHVDYKNNIIFMEDLKVKNFELQERSQFLNLEQAELVMEALGKFHGASLHVLRKNPELKKTFHKYIWGKELAEPMMKMIRNSTTSLEKNTESYGLPGNYSKKLLGTQKECDDGKLEIVDCREDNLNVLCHGDCWMNNMMFHYKDGTPDDVIFLDFQIVNYNSFANDLQYFFFSSVSTDVLTTKLDYLLEKYYGKLKETAPTDEAITLERVKKEFAERYYFGYIMAVMFRPYIAAETPVDMDAVLFENAVQDNGFKSPVYFRDLKLLLPLFDEAGII